MKLPLLFLLLLLPSCVAVRIGPGDDFLEMKGLVHAYGTMHALDGWDGPLFDFGLFTNTKGRNEILSVEVGPLAAVGVGLVGARVRVLPFEFGVGSLFYNPRPRERAVEASTKKKSTKKKDAEELEDDGDEKAPTSRPHARRVF